ncbi:MAG: hypothetical protein NTX03_03085 [Bacteroidetes bacterium]|nr:hypothetical protein [Bacteroidota bacterium]
MKNIFRLVAVLSFAGVLLTSCTSYRTKAEEVAIPLIRALQDDDANDAKCLLPAKSELSSVFDANKGAVGYVYYNKYRQSYSYEVLASKVATDFDIISKITKEQKLDWSGVRYGIPKVEEVATDDANYSKVSVSLQFPGNKVYSLSYNAVRAGGNWCLFNDIYFTPPIAQ